MRDATGDSCFIKKQRVDDFNPEQLPYEAMCFKGGFPRILKEYTTQPTKIIKEQKKFERYMFRTSEDRTLLKDNVNWIDTTKIDAGVVDIATSSGLMGSHVMTFYKVPKEQLPSLIAIQNAIRKKQKLLPSQIIEEVSKSSPSRGKMVQEYYKKLRQDKKINNQMDTCFKNNTEPVQSANLYVVKKRCELPLLKTAKRVSDLENNEYIGVDKKYVAKHLHDIGLTLRDVKEIKYSESKQLIVLDMKDGKQYLYPTLSHRKKFDFADSEIYNARLNLLKSMPEINELKEKAEAILKNIKKV